MPLDLPAAHAAATIRESFTRVRGDSERLIKPLTPEDCMIQSMPEASPAKWNLAHTSWFFETFILKSHAAGYRPYHNDFGYLFNSYYNQIGERHPRAERGMLSRPSLEDVLSYRAHVDEAVVRLLERADDETLAAIAPLIVLGCAHEEQHQELLLTDLQHGLYQNALMPAVYKYDNDDLVEAPALDWREMEGGVCNIGWEGEGFSFDNEGPRHKVYLHPFELSNRPVTNAEFIAFIEDGGYQNPVHWLSDAWDVVNKEEWQCPLYWRKADDGWRQYSLFGEAPVNPHAPVCHVSFYEADAYASWAGVRLPTEFEWEAAASLFPLKGRFLQNGSPRRPAPAEGDDKLVQLFGDVWEWTASPYIAYPGFAPPAGAVGEYNGKFMSGQMVLKGGSCATPEGHLRVSYRNFFYPWMRWQFSGFRLARDCK
ncbi:ergothioneine biosynthesis protein EgtB [Hyphococcus flavus]|uniref:Ergothioneine biosynthesis protein EgtB n=1 Tax=Hyphococcus flavus TaxID=1866326 RepID=A0AAE9ZAF2_9PROT|nr:ergothioneine biosynthesis protein EgtB [Hyphococcus flavus]WDI30574.1 ergothioneine biosynthesis protein EgtB [Hyphococcus flavus]